MVAKAAREAGFVNFLQKQAGKRGRPKTKDGKIDMENLDLTRMEKMEMKDIEGTAYTLIAYSKALRCKVRLVIWQMPNGKKKLFFSTDTSLSGEEVLLYYRTRFHIDFCFRDAKGYTCLLYTSQLGRYGSHVEQTYRNAFGLKKSKSIDWLKLNASRCV